MKSEDRTQKLIPLSVPNFEGNERKYVDDALDQGWVSTGGAYITELEHKLEEYLHIPDVAVNPVRYQLVEPVFIDCYDSFFMHSGKLRKFFDGKGPRKG